MKRMAIQFWLRASFIAMAFSAMTTGNAAFAQSKVGPQAPADSPTDTGADASVDGKDIIVTGSSIKGIAPVGSNLVSVGQENIEKVAAINATELVNTIPAISTSGAAPLGENAFSYFSPQIHSLAGSASNTTLVITDGLRMPGGGIQFAQIDPNIIPTTAIQRVEVLADGASSVYGSDAVAGVVNFITRRTFDGIEVNGKIGFGDHFRSYDVSGIWGTKWDTGGVYVAAQYSDQSPIRNIDRGFLSLGDYRSVGGRNIQSFACSPATIRTPASGNNVFLSPSATTTVPNIPDNSPCNNTVYDTAIQNNTRENILVKVTNDFSERLTFTGMMNYNHLDGKRNLGPGGVSNITVFGPGSGKGGQINPFFLAPAGELAATQETISWIGLRQDNDYGIQSAENDTFYATAVFDYKISNAWSVKLSEALGRSRSALITRDAFCGACAILALNGTAQTGGSTTASAIPGENVIALNLPLTSANALDVWRGLGSSQTTAGVLKRIYSNNSSTVHVNRFNQLKLEAQGTLFPLPAGAVRLAVGGEYLTTNQDVEGINGSNISSSNTASSYRIFKLGRKVYSGYAELFVPLVSEGMDVPLVRSFDVNVSARYDHYDDVGSTTNPKFAANWEVVEGLRLRGNYATAFVAPPSAAIGDPALGYMRDPNGASQSGTLIVPVANYPTVTQLPGCAGQTVSCQIGTSSTPGLTRSYGIGPTAKPQTGSSWSVGIDFNPTFLPGFSTNITYWSNKFRGGVNRPEAVAILNSQALASRLTLCPTGCTQAQVDTFTNVANGASVSGTIPSTVFFLINFDSGNLLNLDVEGIDAIANYRIDAGSTGIFTLGGSMTYFTRFDQDFGDTPFSVLNTSGFNSTFPSVRARGRATLSWEKDGFGFDGFMNYTGSYRNWSNLAINPVVRNAAGIPSGGGDLVNSNITFDFNVHYRLGAGAFEGSSFFIDVKNLTDRDPPFYSGNTNGIGVGGYGYNGFLSNPIGRVISAGFRAKF
jgi:iron complex outermembrane recepter protein